MGRLLPVLLMRVATLVMAGLLLFAVFGKAKAQDDNYGLKRFSGDNYDTLSAPGRAAPAAQYVPAPSATPYGYKPMAPVQPAFPAPRAVTAAPLPQGDRQGDRYAYYGASNFEYVLGPGDKLKLTVFGESDLSGDFTIDGAGFIRLPLVGEVRAAGYTSQQLEGAIAASLSPAYLKSPRIAVEVATYRPFYIIGAVNRPGQYPYVDHMTALNAVALAGGFLPSAVESVVFVRREGSNQEIEVPADRTTAIHPGDVVKVHTTFFADAVTFLSPFSGAAASAATAAVIQ
ncbi:MAG TPA: polysaccharide biosynthesis/export family protein [Rhizomicrobium sp.]|nr:polysaccharide biosynthesis/export family protein [Rhizomicrobium sp.]